MLWIVLGIVAAVVLLAFLASFVRFRAAPGHDRPQRPAAVQEVSAQQQVVVRGPDGEERRFSSLDEMPAELRAAVEKADPRKVKRRIVVMRDGHREEYESLDAVPEELRKYLR